MNTAIIFILQGSSGGALSFVFPALLLAFFYFFFIRPQTKKQKEQSNFQTGLEKGDEVVTASGIIGQVNKIEDDAVTLQINDKTFIRVVPGAISKEMTDQYNKVKK
ncbi:MAG: preprotein translocase subunit YajC [Saprospiraceae bacterium]|nr:preprotein translocase subunit YajC [Saprospiraceae bacterium]